MKTKFRIPLIFFFFISVVLFISCGKPCIESRGIEGAGLTITFFNTANNEYFYPENTSLSSYNIDSLRVKDSNGKLLTTPYHLKEDSANSLKRFMVPTIYPILFHQTTRLLMKVNKQNLFISSTITTPWTH